ncbi:MAG TPA: hypothetical protein EYG18_05885 [Micavibrio sp.]|nr:hypothetical protein [Pseudomonadota bacterium]HIF26631.1 hypothetical protein [Micavibrio sp.]HIL28780.1 hypothetical protein [Micavibrio sp.]
MSFKNSALSASEGQIFTISSIVIVIITILCAIFPPLGELIRAGLLWAGAFLFGIPYMLLIFYIVKEAINDILKATGSELQIDTDELVRDLKEIFMVDKAEAVLEEKKAIRAEKMKHKEKTEEEMLNEMIFMDEDDDR